jgi:hypothetical protein
VTISARDAPQSGKRVRWNPPKRFERRETFVPPVTLRGAKDSAESPPDVSRERELGMREVRVQ